VRWGDASTHLRTRSAIRSFMHQGFCGLTTVLAGRRSMKFYTEKLQHVLKAAVRILINITSDLDGGRALSFVPTATAVLVRCTMNTTSTAVRRDCRPASPWFSPHTIWVSLYLLGGVGGLLGWLSRCKLPASVFCQSSSAGPTAS